MSEPAESKPVQRIEKDIDVLEDEALAIDLLASECALSKQKLKLAMEKGGVWLKKAKGGRRRLRRAKTIVHQGDVLALRYDAHILASIAPEPRLIADKLRYSVWYKPAGMLSQGSKFADHCAITRWIEKNHLPRRAVYLVHRLDRAASGLMLIAHDSKTAAQLSKIFHQRRIQKRYSVVVEGHFDETLPLTIETPIDGKEALSKVLSTRTQEGQSKLVVEIKTGRKHQIRKHLSERGWPVVGDSVYGAAKPGEALQLEARSLEFHCPISGKLERYLSDQP